jgi:DeoR/GlpR family transcriptional regulator of sugar metabolism
VITLLKICNLDKVNVIITDSKLNPKVLNKYRENGVEVVNDYKGMEEDNI